MRSDVERVTSLGCSAPGRCSLNPSRSHMENQVVVIIPEDPKILYSEVGINSKQKVLCFMKDPVFFSLMFLFF